MSDQMPNCKSKYVSGRQPKRILDKMSKYMSDRMPDRMPRRMPYRKSSCIFVSWNVSLNFKDLQKYISGRISEYMSDRMPDRM